jgi:hypothetical protein
MKRLASLAVLGTIALGSIMAPANAAPIIPNSSSQTNPSIVQVWGGCGWGFHPNPWGRCVPNRWGYSRYRPYYGYRPYWRSYSYGGDYYYPHWRHRYWYGY